MPVQLRNGQADLMFILALWHELMSAWHPEQEPMAAPMPLRHEKANLATLLRATGEAEVQRINAERACAFDVVLRLASGQIDTMHAEPAFFTRGDNGKWFTRFKIPGINIFGAQLTSAALTTWNNASGQQQESALAEARRLLESDVESGNVIVQLLPLDDGLQVTHAQAEMARPAAAEKPPRDGRFFLQALVRQLDLEPFQPVYRKRPQGQPVTGWHARLSSYFWPAPHVGYRETQVAMCELIAASRRLAQALLEGRSWTKEEQDQAVRLAHAVFKWGGVPQDTRTVNPATVQAVYEAALADDATSQALMNSGWTKVAAFATASMEEEVGGRPQAIWDSRVATSIVSRLEQVVPADVDMAGLFPDVGTVPGRGGTRPRPLGRKWPSGYRTWRGQVAGSSVVREIRDILNDSRYPLPKSEGGPTRWTTRDVEMVLFMDGY